MSEGNHQEYLVEYFYYLSQGLYHISFIELISSNIDNWKSNHNHTITFKDFDVPHFKVFLIIVLNKCHSTIIIILHFCVLVKEGSNPNRAWVVRSIVFKIDNRHVYKKGNLREKMENTKD